MPVSRHNAEHALMMGLLCSAILHHTTSLNDRGGLGEDGLSSIYMNNNISCVDLSKAWHALRAWQTRSLNIVFTPRTWVAHPPGREPRRVSDCMIAGPSRRRPLKEPPVCYRFSSCLLKGLSVWVYAVVKVAFSKEHGKGVNVIHFSVSEDRDEKRSTLSSEASFEKRHVLHFT